MTDTNKSNRRGLPGILTAFVVKTNVKGAEYGHGQVQYNKDGKLMTTSIVVSQYSPSQKEAFAALRATEMGASVDLFGEFKAVMANGKATRGRFFDVVKVGGRPVRAPKQAVAA